jgi:hypothetical protein
MHGAAAISGVYRALTHIPIDPLTISLDLLTIPVITI